MSTESDQAPVLLQVSAAGVATVTLNRPQVRNAYDGRVVQILSDMLAELDARADVRAVVLEGAGPSFCAGADLAWMRRSGGLALADNQAEAERLAVTLRRLYTLRKPTLALVQGHCMAGGLGFISACDIVVAERSAQFGVTEVRIGLIASTIAPYLVAAIGPRIARQYFLTGERFLAAEAHRIGLVHEVVEDRPALQERRDRVLAALVAGAPGALAASKDLVDLVAWRSIDDALTRETAVCMAATRAGAEAREGMDAFLQKRRPAWAADSAISLRGDRT
jgi:methylglutaconyl-CoA hydratase